MPHHKTTENNVLCVFRERAHLERALDELMNSGVLRDHISLVMLSSHYPMEATATSGGYQQGAARIMSRLSHATVPGLGPVWTTGPFGIHLCNEIAGGSPGGFLRALGSLGLNEEEARLYEHTLRDGGILMVVECGDRCDQVRATCASCGGALGFGHQMGMGQTWSGTMPGTGYPGYPRPRWDEDIETD